VLSMLEALRDEMLRGTTRLRSWREPKPPVATQSAAHLTERSLWEQRPGTSRKIISAHPLIEDLAKGERADGAQPVDSESGAQPHQQQGTPAT